MFLIFFFIHFLFEPTGLPLTDWHWPSSVPDARLNLLSFKAQKGLGWEIYWTFSGWSFFSVTIVEKEKFDGERKVLTITDKFRTVEKILSCVTLEDFLLQGRYKSKSSWPGLQESCQLKNVFFFPGNELIQFSFYELSVIFSKLHCLNILSW